MAPRELADRVYRLRIVLDGTDPQVWRRIEVPADHRLSQLHVVIQIVMDWEHAHPHAFEFGKRRYGGEGAFDSDGVEEFETRVGDVLSRKGSRGVYTYDFGDDWRHLIVVEATGEADPDTFYPRILDGHGGGPPEDCGGVYGFERLRHLRDHPEELGRGEHGDAEEQRMWVESLESDDLDVAKIQQELRGFLDGTALEDDGLLADEDLSPVRPVSLPPEEELAAVAVATSPLHELLALARWVSTGTRLTETGVPRPKDVRTAAEKLDLWPHASDAEAEERTEQVARLRAARDLPEFLDLWNDAVELGLIEISSGRAYTSSELLGSGPTPDRVLEWWTELFDLTVEWSVEDGGGEHGPFSGLELVYMVLRTLYEAPDGFAIDLAEVAGLMASGIEEGFAEFDDAEDAGAAAGHFSEDRSLVTGTALPVLYRAMLMIERSGGVTVADATRAEVRGTVLDRVPSGSDPWTGPTAPHIDCSAALTPLGRHGVRQMLLRTGVPAPLNGETAGAGAAEFLDALAAVPPDLHAAEIAAWLAARTPTEAVRQVVEAASEPTGAGAVRRSLGSEVLGSAGEGALAELRALLGSDRREVSGLAASSLLLVRGLEEEEGAALYDEYGHWLTIDGLAGPLALGEETFEYLIELATEMGEGPFVQVLASDAEDLWKVDHPATVEVLEALGRLHPDKKAAKAARHAAHKAQSRR